MSIVTSTLGFPRMGARRELKAAVEEYWSGKIDAAALFKQAAALRSVAWTRQRALGVGHIPSNDFSLYDHVLDTTVTVGAIPDAYGWQGGDVPLDTYFAMARGARGRSDGDLPALEMTKWFDTNYHHLVPEFRRGQSFSLASSKPVEEFREAKALGFNTRPVLVGPVTYLLLGKSKDEALQPLTLLPGLLPVYAEVLRRLAIEGADWVQIDEPCLAVDLSEAARNALTSAYETLAREAPAVRLLVTTYFGGLRDNLDTALRLPVAGLHLDLARAPDQLRAVDARAPTDLVLSLGVVDGRNIWRANLEAVLNRIEPLVAWRGADKVMIGPSCSLLHVPLDLAFETDFDPDLRGWMAFAVQKIEELTILSRALDQGRDAMKDALADATAAAEHRATSRRIHDKTIQARLAAITPEMVRRRSAFPARRQAQRACLGLPPFPTTTIGSFPQTEEVRSVRRAHARGALGDAEYETFLRAETAAAVRWQEEIGLDVLVHGEFERNDMVQYFAEQLTGCAITKHGWVQSYGSRYVRPPIIYGDVLRPKPMTVGWAAYAQSLTRKPVKGMLTGPVTIMQWSFVRDDLSRGTVCRQIALALRDEVLDLERAGIRLIQIDEPAFREGLPLRRADWEAYLDWAVECFRLASAVVTDETQIHTHMCYSEFNDIIESIAAMDADVISIETARSRMELLKAFTGYRYPNEIGPGVYDIHAPRWPRVDEMWDMLAEVQARLATDQIWVNPDCGLKTRSWEEVRPALINMVEAAKLARAAHT
jgi:5-methyltetrahydropteroyltriglutamate--homocysteine methyltransferase